MVVGIPGYFISDIISPILTSLKADDLWVVCHELAFSYYRLEITIVQINLVCGVMVEPKSHYFLNNLVDASIMNQLDNFDLLVCFLEHKWIS